MVGLGLVVRTFISLRSWNSSCAAQQPHKHQSSSSTHGTWVLGPPKGSLAFVCLCAPKVLVSMPRLVDRVKCGLESGIAWNMTASGKNETQSFPSWHSDCARSRTAERAARPHQPQLAQPSSSLLSWSRAALILLARRDCLTSPEKPSQPHPPSAGSARRLQDGCCWKFALGSSTRCYKGH